MHKISVEDRTYEFIMIFCNKIGRRMESQNSTFLLLIIAIDFQNYWDIMNWVINKICKKSCHFVMNLLCDFNNIKPSIVKVKNERHNCTRCENETILETQSRNSLEPGHKCIILLSNSKMSNIIFTISNRHIRETVFGVAFTSEICEVDVHIKLWSPQSKASG